MKTKVELTNVSDDSVHVDEVDVYKGIIVKNESGKIALVVKLNGKVNVWWTSNENGSWFNSVSEMMKSYSRCEFTTLDGVRITADKPILVVDLKDSSNVGWVHPDGKKGYIAYLGGGEFKKLTSYTNKEGQDVCNVAYNAGETFKSLPLAARAVSEYADMYRFDTRKELYAWLAE